MGEPELRPAAKQMIAQCRRMFELGDYRRAILALKWCVAADVPLPDWLANETEEAMRFYYNHGGAEKRGELGHRAKVVWSQIHMARYRAVARELDRLGNKRGRLQEALSRAAELLSGTNARGQAREIEKSYKRVSAELKNSSEPT